MPTPELKTWVQGQNIRCAKSPKNPANQKREPEVATNLNVSRAANVGSAADAKRDRLSAIPLAVTHLTNSRREGRMLSPFGQHCYERVGTRHLRAPDTR
jgi:hypothetical protein